MEAQSTAPIRLTAEEMAQLSIALGGPENYLIMAEAEFLAHTGCPEEKRENWLATSWIQHDIKRVLAGTEKVGPQPWLLVRNVSNGTAVRLFCPTRRLLVASIEEDSRVQLRRVIASRAWSDNAEEIISQLEVIAGACSNRLVSTIEVKLLWLALWPAIQILLELRDRPFTEYLKRLHAAAAALGRACQERGSDQSPQAKFGEAKASSRRALGENHNPVLDRFPELVEVSRRACSHDLATYMTDEVRLPADQFLDMAHVLAHDGAKAAAVANPPARIRLALARNERRRQRLYRQRWKQPTPEQTDGLRDPHNVELSANAMLDWERVRQGLPPDQTRAVEARIDGVNLQALDAADHLGWDAARLNAIRRSLEPDRRWGQILRKRLSSYNSKRDSSQ